ncbi:MAG: hydrogenase small subunit [Alphaproteobacteria bacterium]|jgi:hydrogenase small subunit|nr:hydrogenase small subunit [Alphaproteobacteria bacterium]
MVGAATRPDPRPAESPDEFGDLDGYVGALGGLTRRDFLKFCTGIAATLGLSPAFGVTIANAATSPRRPPVIWISAQECTGCTESLLRAYHPTIESLILDHISLDYHEVLCAGAGHQAEEFKHRSMEENWGQYVMVVDGSIPTRDGGIYCKIAGETVLDIARHTAEGAAAVIAIGSCAAWGGIPASDPNPTDARPASDIITDKPVVNIPGCPPNPYNFLATVLHFLTFNELPGLDEKNRPRFAYGRLIHENCERRPHFDAGRFAREFGDPGHRQGWCLYQLGCKGPETYANCPAIGFNDVGESAWPVGIGAPCFGCTEQGIGFTKSLHSLSSVQSLTPPTAFPRIVETSDTGITPAAAALAAGIGGAAIGAGAVLASRLAKHAPAEGEGPGNEGRREDR